MIRPHNDINREFKNASSGGFTLLELMISIIILSLIMLYLYQSLSSLRTANTFYGEKLELMARESKLLKVLYLDLSLSKKGSVTVTNEDKQTDIVLMQTSNSIHRRIMPYVGYIIKEGVLYRVESLDKLTYPLGNDLEMDVDEVGKVATLRLYGSKTHFLLHLAQAKGDDILVKIRQLN